ncbi:hypothetical protein PPYR_05746 [Photinus pyralis]|uniref:RecQ-mediated genome instability protein 1 n=3 Tax=Photinus pyralis TaxID=7054 RepID=A0A5N4AVJ6_PHOPY|nr:uncharacterized protein LOC116166192 [Photinus pyralis]KAB0801392.1 hypothetical protein PPYR_05746 [Photinus pyralis]
MSESLSVKRFFQSHHITLSDYWLESCIQWYQEENPNVNYSIETLNSAVYEQWLLLDLRDVEVPILPPNLAQQKKISLNNVYCLQLLYVQDISQPKLSQLQKIRTPNVLVDSSITDQEPKFYTGSKRMLQMVLTDGVQQIEAIEYKPIPLLKANIKPGSKIKITGPVQVRRGQIMLESKHLQLLGGEVEEILIPNAYENVLARALRLPENPHPTNVEESSVPVTEGRTNRNVQNSIPQQLRNMREVATNVPIVNTIAPSIDLEDTLITDEVDMLLEAERDVAKDYVAVENQSYRNKGLEICNRVDLQTTRKDIECVDLTKEFIPTVNDSLFADIDAHLDFIDKQQGNVSSNSSHKVVSIAYLLKSNAKEGEFVIRAQYKRVLQKLSVCDDGWTLVLLIGDETDELEAKVHTNVVSNLVGYHHSAVMAIRKNVINKDKKATSALMTSIEGLKTKLMNIDGEIVLMYNSEERFPVITQIL